MTAGEKLADDVAALVKSRNPIIWVVTAEEGRVERSLIDAITRKARYEVRLWDCASGVTDVLGKELKKIGDRAFDGKSMTDIAEVLNAISANKERAVWILRDAPLPWLQDPQTRRRLRNLARELPDCERDDARSIIILSPTAEVPPDLADHAVVIKWELPDRAEIAGVLDKILEEIGPDLAATACPPAERDLAIEAAVGLTAEAASSSYSKSLVTQGKRILPAYVAAEKKRVVSGKGIEWFDADPRGLDALGGLEYLKPWLLETRLCFGQRARDFGLPAPKGVFLTGIPGCLHGDTPIQDPIDGTVKTIKERYEEGVSFNVTAMTPGGASPALALPPVKYDAAKMIRFTMEVGKTITVTEGHRFWTGLAWVYASEVYELTQECERDRLSTTSGSVQLARSEDALHLSGTHGAFYSDYHRERVRDEPLLFESENGRYAFLQLDGVREHSPGSSHSDDRADGSEHNRLCRQYDRHAKPSCDVPYKIGGYQIGLGTRSLWTANYQNVLQHLSAKHLRGTFPQLQYLVAGSTREGRVSYDDDKFLRNDRGRRFVDDEVRSLRQEFVQRDSRSSLEDQRPLEESFLFDTDQLPAVDVQVSNAYTEEKYTRTVKVVKAELLPAEPYYDFHVPIYNNYAACGLWHHNCGKSLSAKATATAFGCPLLRADFGASQSKWIGESQQNIRAVFAIAEAVGRCVLWIDEIEKSLAGATGGAADGGVSSDALGTFLQWMQERKGEVFVVATANDVTKLPPELLRKGRFDELFFVDLPTSSERADILQVTLRQFKRADHPVDVPAVVSATKEFTGSEIAALLPAALRKAYADGERQITTMDLVDAARATVPLSRTMPEKIEALREWSKTRARPASLPEVSTTVKGGRKLDM